MSIFSGAIDCLVSTLLGCEGVEVAYCRTDGSTATFCGWPGDKTDNRMPVEFEGLSEGQLSDWLFPVSEMNFVPECGESFVCDGVTYEVLQPTSSNPVWRFEDNNCKLRRVHTRIQCPA